MERGMRDLNGALEPSVPAGVPVYHGLLSRWRGVPELA